MKVAAMANWRTCDEDSFPWNDVCSLLYSTIQNNQSILSVSECQGRYIGVQWTDQSGGQINLCEVSINSPNSNGISITSGFYERACNTVGNNGNLALNKTVLGSRMVSSSNKFSYATDGVMLFNDKCFVTYGYNNYIIVDLEKEVDISFVRVQSTYWDIAQMNAMILTVTNVMRECNSMDMYQFDICPGSSVSSTPDDIWEWKVNSTGQCKGRYLVIRKQDPNFWSWFKVCEIEIFGNEIGAVSSANSMEFKCEVTTTAENIALNKPILTLFPWNTARITDGFVDQNDIWSQCYYSYKQGLDWVVIDLEGVYRISFIRIWNSLSGSGTHYTTDIGISKEFYPQYWKDYLHNVTIVGKDMPNYGGMIEIHLDPSQNIDTQFIYIRKPTNYLDSLIICEVEVKGTVQTNQTAYLKPDLPSAPVVPQSQADFPLMSLLRQNVSHVHYEAWSGYLVSATDKCEGVLWHPSVIFPYAMACTIDQGRVFSFGKWNYVEQFLDSLFDSDFKSNLWNWLSPTKGIQANLVYSTNIDSAQDGDIIYLIYWQSHSQEQKDKILSHLKLGKVGLVMDITYWAQLYNGPNRQNYDYLLEALGLEYPMSWIYGASYQVDLAESDYVDKAHLSLLQMIERMTESKHYIEMYKDEVESYLKKINRNYLRQGEELKSVIATFLTTYQSYVKYICPGEISPMEKGADEYLIYIYNILALSQSGGQFDVPCVDLFPGKLLDGRPQDILTNVDVQLIGEFQDDIHPTGLYLAPGGKLDYNVISKSGKWEIAIGSHWDELYLYPNDVNYKWKRYPIVSTEFIEIEDNQGSIWSNYGGLVHIRNVDVNVNMEIELSGIVMAPIFNIRAANADSIWENTRQNGSGPWAEIAGEHLVIITRTADVSDMEIGKLREIVDLWDEVIGLMHSLRGTSGANSRRIRIVLDLQVAYGTAHAGYPIVMPLDWEPNVFNITVIQHPESWGVVHELGHELQENHYTVDGAIEITVNIFTDFIWAYKWGVGLYSGQHEKFTENHKQAIKDHFEVATGPTYQSWLNDPILAYATYGSLAHHFGWGLYQQTLTNYSLTRPSFTNDADKWDRFIETMSTYAGMNLSPVFDFWNIPISTETKQNLISLPCFLPDDVITELVPERRMQISTMYSDACQTTPLNVLQFVQPANMVQSKPNDAIVSY